MSILDGGIVITKILSGRTTSFHVKRYNPTSRIHKLVSVWRTRLQYWVGCQDVDTLQLYGEPLLALASLANNGYPAHLNVRDTLIDLQKDFNIFELDEDSYLSHQRPTMHVLELRSWVPCRRSQIQILLLLDNAMTLHQRLKTTEFDRCIQT